jgi:four helix bundle protein
MCRLISGINLELYKTLRAKNEFVISKQLLRSATSIGANANEASAAQSKKDFIAKWLFLQKKQEKHIIG